MWRRPKKPVRTVKGQVVRYMFIRFRVSSFSGPHMPLSARGVAPGRWRRNSCSDEVCACVVFGGRSQAHRRRKDGRGGTVLIPCKISEFGVWRGPAGIWEFLQGFEAFADTYLVLASEHPPKMGKNRPRWYANKNYVGRLSASWDYRTTLPIA